MTEIVLPIAAAIAIGGIIFHAGRLSARVDALEHGHEKMDDDVEAIRAALENIREAITARRV